MRLVELVQASHAAGSTRSRLEKIDALATAIRSLAPPEVAIGVPYLCGDIRQGKIGIGYSRLSGLAESDAAVEPALELSDVDMALEQVARVKGPGSARIKLEILLALFARATREEQDFLRRLLVGELRQGALEGILIEAVAKGLQVDSRALRRAVMLSGRLDTAASAVALEGRAALDELRLELLRPIKPMLAQTIEGADEALERLGVAACEYKLDGARVQVHRVDDEVRVFSRTLNEVTDRVPEIVTAALAMPARSFILDGEVIALRDDQSPQPFQVTMRRFGRRVNVGAAVTELPLRAYHFDCLHFDGQDVFDAPLQERMVALDSIVPSTLRTPRCVARSSEEVGAFYERALTEGHEGIMLKSLDASYEAGRRGAGWLKLKPAVTLDLVVLAAEWGSGRRKGWLSNLHLGARDPETGGFAMLGKTFKGMTDEVLRWQTEQLLARETGRDEHTVYVRPELVVEIAFDSVQESPHYPSGMALRFARLKRYRQDKQACDADDIDAVRDWRRHRGD